jgi:phage major head subunit gpT-like protein
MLINPAVLSATRVTVDKRVSDSYKAVSEGMLWYKSIATEVPSTGSGITYFIEQTLPRLRKWVGPRVVANIKRKAYTVLNDPYEATVEVGVDDIADDNLQVYNSAFDGLGRSARLWPNDVIYGAWIVGGTALCLDDQPFFNGSHPLEVAGAAVSVQSNLHTSMSLTAANYGTVRMRMRKLLGEDNKPLGVGTGKLLLAVPPDLEDTARRIVQNDFAGYLLNTSSTAQDNNIYKGTAEVLVVPELASDSTSTWYLLDPSFPVKPFMMQIRETPNTVISMDRPNADNVFELNVARFGVKGRGAAAYGMWQLAHKCTA